MKISISLPEEEVTFIDDYARTQRIASRSAVVRRAVELLRRVDLGDDYAAAWAEWAKSDDSSDWERAADDGIAD